jgi:hypothetical protein
VSPSETLRETLDECKRTGFRPKYCYLGKYIMQDLHKELGAKPTHFLGVRLLPLFGVEESFEQFSYIVTEERVDH